MSLELIGILGVGLVLSLLMLKLHTKSEKSSDEAHAAIGKNIKGVEDRVTGRIDDLSNLVVTKIGDQVSKNTELLEKLVNKTESVRPMTYNNQHEQQTSCLHHQYSSALQDLPRPGKLLRLAGESAMERRACLPSLRCLG